ncbi:MAG: dimethylmenaquinone methyltransferase [Arenimonas sp. SCN 70-307]|uniref:FAD-binding oxidoreductase n=1 Tax=Arenimonas sp. SCN 70-307 TaxID=1660089 RepID=UPI00086A3DB4|nr:FAD-linked oxidase C-terminal domain-containing protein [Arenimonas sp. SCN 70-307]ODS63118.1 MAG: dimethylmenaquinone methyltransferase [Arenimonas sp. SCN 70-307]
MGTLPADLIDELGALLGPGGLLLDAAERLAYGYDNSRRQGLPLAVALPTNAAQVQAIVRLCRAHRLPIVARGRGTNTTGASVPGEDALVVSFERMNRLLDVRPGDRVAVVEPGLLNGDLQAALAPHGLFWPPDPTSAAFSSIGGNLACNAGGPRAVKYGATRDNVLALKAVTGTGERVEFGAATTKGASGYDLSRLLIGSEGTLALIVEATLRLTPTPTHRRALRAIYADVESAAAAVARLMAQPVTPSMLEFMDGDCVRLAREVGGADLPVGAGALLMLEADGEAAVLDAAEAALRRAAEGPGCLSVDAAASEAGRETLWAARKALSPALRTLAPGKINEDVVVPVSRIPDLVAAVRAAATAQSLAIVCFGHAGNGNLHVNILYDPADPAQAARANAALESVFDAVIALGGLVSGEHGIGLAKRELLARSLSPATLALMRAIKAQFDPDDLLNPGKVLPPV